MLITIRQAWFVLKMSQEVAGIFNMGSEMDTAINLGLCIDFVSNLGCFIFIPTSIYLIPMLF